jgi:C-terminal processing protease CtpA/Prc
MLALTAGFINAAETFTQALIDRTPRVTRVGGNTQGVFSDVLDRHLPNGWTFGLPNTVYRMSDRRIFDVSGIPADLAVPVFADDDVAAGRDPAMAAAMQLLATK